MRRRLLPMGVLALAVVGSAALAVESSKPSGKGTAAPFDPKLPSLGAQLAVLPDGAGKETASSACLTCHSTDILRQQRLTEGQWAASVKKMVGWGAEVPEEKRGELVQYLTAHFGPNNDRFEPVVTRPVGR